jgi:ATP-dependent Lhr-like helicase
LRSYDSDPARLALAVDALVGAVRRGVLGRLLVERADGEPVIAAGDTPLAATLQAAGFIATPRGLRMRA